MKVKIMKTTIKKIGNSTGSIIPSKPVKDLNMTQGPSLRLEHDKDHIASTPVKPKYTLAELVAQCDLNSPSDASTILKDWENLVPVGKEIID